MGNNWHLEPRGDGPIISTVISFGNYEAFGLHDKSFAPNRLPTEVKEVDTNHFSLKDLGMDRCNR